MPNGQQGSTGQGVVSFGLTIALVGLAFTASPGSVIPVGENTHGLTGQASTSAAGSMIGSTLSGSLLNSLMTARQGVVYAHGRSMVQGSQGIAVPALSVALLGQASVTESGFVSPNAEGTVPLVGAASSVLAGTLTAPGTQALTGSESTSAAGTLEVTFRPTDPVGQSVTLAQGTVSIEANNVTVNIVGTEMAMEPGSVDATPVLTGQVSTSGVGSVTGSTLSGSLLNSLMTMGQGVLMVQQAPGEDTFIQSGSGVISLNAFIPLLGASSTGATGSLGITGDVAQALAGSVSTSAAGSVMPVPQVALLGDALTSAQQNMGAPGFGALLGQSITAQQGTLFVTNDREQALSGSVSTMVLGTVGVDSRPSLLGLTQSTGIGTMGRSGGNMQQALTGSSSTWTTGSLGPLGGDVLQPGVANEGCSIVSATAVETETSPSASGAEGCFIQSGVAKEV